MSEGLIVALDVGGTNSRGEVVDADLKVFASARSKTPFGDGERTLEVIEELCRTLLDKLSDEDRARVRAVGIGLPGLVDSARGVVQLASNLGWVDAPVAELLSNRLGLSVRLFHDVASASLAERMRGAGRGVSDLLSVFIGTGVAATIVAGGRSITGALHQAGELGHVPIDPEGRACPCGQRGCLEQYVSARAIGLDYATATGQEDVTSYDVFRQLETDPIAAQVWSDALDALAHGLLGVITMLSPERIVIGGGLSEAGDALVVPLRQRLEDRARVAVVPQIVTAELGQRAGIIGAALATFEDLTQTRSGA